MNNLIDTHAFIWFINGDSDLSDNAKKAIEHQDANNFISIASLWEIAIKISLGKLELKTSFAKLAEQIELNGFQILSVTFEDTLLISELPFHHRDPFDRIIIAQSIANRLSIITKDKLYEGYQANIIW